MLSIVTRRFGTVLLLCVSVLAFGGERKFEKKFDVKSGGTLRLTTDVGEVRISGGSTSGVSIIAVIDGRDADEFEVTANQVGNDVEIQGKAKKSGFWHNTRVDVEYTILVPTEYGVSVHSSGGDVEVKSLKGSVKAETSGGSVAIRDITGKVDGESSGGSMSAENISGDVRLETSGGGIKAQSVTGDVQASTSGGGIKLRDIKGRVDAETSGGSIGVAVTGPNKGINVETSGGGIDIVIEKSAGAEIDASTSGGGVECDLPVTVKGKLDGSHIRGTVNGGGPLIRAHTSGGGIRIRSEGK